MTCAGGNHLLTSHKIQKELCRACAEGSTKSIIPDIGDMNLSLLADESRDGPIEEQMVMVLRLVACLLFCYLHAINCFFTYEYLSYASMLRNKVM
jgi:hypothetical protein